MNEDASQGAGGLGGDEAYERLVGADPGAGAAPRRGVLRAKVEVQVADGASAGEARGTPPGGAVPETVPETVPEAAPGGVPAAVDATLPTGAAGTGAAGRRAWRHRRAPALVAAAVAGAVVLGGGGYALGVLTGGGTAGDASAVADAAGFAVPGSAQRPVPAIGSAADGALSAGEQATEPARDSGAAPSAAGSRAAWYPFVGHTVFRGVGLPEEGGSAAVFAFDAGGAANAETAARVARALGVAGEPRRQGQQWFVGPDEGSGPQVWLLGDGRASFGYANQVIDPWSCAAPDVAGACRTPAPTSVDDAGAATALADAMRALGLDPGQFEVAVAPRGDKDAVRQVTARRVVGGTLSDDQWIATVADAGIVWLDGALADVVELGTYAVVSPAEAVRRLGDPRFGASSAVMPLGTEDRAVASADGASADGASADGAFGDGAPADAVPAPPAAGARIAWPVSEVTITGARLGLTELWTAQGAVLFVPAYELTDADGHTWSVMAVADDALDFSVPDR
ncbi:hypothetical protein ET495_11015 [Xylanimonas allomyrinae]|uniref:Uncharacterized protein n=1 Tax=Xylanimonas allomyrinae TaxID=2509459 RepID=A0A4P6EQI8_9MICO|nr:hypothetical protein [Xylanimonas allomyrinae]QAY63689.1 hypothetical protein ET495_11015 [Xylanimonas allomyrinae]